MNKGCIIFIVRKEYDDLGTGYLSSMLSSAGFSSVTADIREGEEKILELARSRQPLIIGFSVIYQYYIGEFISLARYLRQNGINCHFTAGGHYATIRCGELFSLVPGIDSIVRSEGEHALAELAESLCSGDDWRNIRNIVYRKNGQLIVNKARPLLEDLDALPWPVRDPPRYYAPGIKFATILAGRGCVHKCSFCNLRDFYAPFPGPSRRNRKPEMVADEMEYLLGRNQCQIFLFQDDDFPLAKKDSAGWILRFCDELDRRKLSGRILWKINCRPDEVDENLFARMKETGLFLVFLGIEDGTNEGLKLMNKHLTVSDISRALAILKKLRIEFDYGFMLFTPSTTFETLAENLDFLDSICRYGYSPVSYLKMMPYYETQVEKDLRAGGRLKTDSGFSDYDFSDPRLNDYFRFISGSFSEWINSSDGLVNIAKWARNYLSVYSRFNMLNGALPFLEAEFRASVSRANSFLTSMHRELALLFSEGESPSGELLSVYSKRIRSGHLKFRKQVNDVMYACMSLVSVSGAGRPGEPGAGLSIGP